MLENFKNNLLFGKLVLIISFMTMGFFPLAIFIGAKMHAAGIRIGSIYFITGFLAILILVSGVLFIISLILNINESKKIKTISRGLKYTLISIAPVFLCYSAVIIKALTEGH
jgi:hypothetical protein